MTEHAVEWSTATEAQVRAALAVTTAGLDEAEAGYRLATHGPNRLPKQKTRDWLARLATQLNSMLIHVMLVSAAIAALLGHGVDALVIVLVVVINTAAGILQEGKAEKALEAIQGMVAPRASILREGRRLQVDAESIVPGDVVLLEAGDRVPADLRLVHARALKIEEAALTGESVPVEKSADPVGAGTPLAEQSDMAFSGTFVATGQGTGIAVATGSDTELGRISAMLGQVAPLKTPLLRKIDRLTRQLTIAILGAAALLFILAYFLRGYPLADAFMVVVGFAVAVIPEGLPAVITITLAIGVHRMARRHAIIRHLPAVETLGSVSVICSDKTGTFTRNEMMARHIATAQGVMEVSGAGYAPFGSVSSGGVEIALGSDPALAVLCRAALLCNDASLRREADTGWTVAGDPMEGALVALSAKAGFEQDETRRQMPRLDEIPFDAQHRFMATLHHDHQRGDKFMVVKGAPEKLVTMCEHELMAGGIQPLRPDHWLAQIEKLAAEGERVLALAGRAMPPQADSLIFNDAKAGLTLFGLVGLIDPPREEAIAAVRDCRAAGIRVVMITGDHGVTALAIARQLGLADEPRVLTGQQLDQLDEPALHEAAKTVTVFARANPEHKLRLVRALQIDREVIAMTGDGVNDAPALKQADVGIAMGNKGTAVAREAAQIVLADDNFASIVAAVREGRTVYDNLRKVIAWTLPTNVGEVLAIMVAVMLGVALPITPVQTLWVNMVTSVALGLVLAFEPTEPDTMRRMPRAPSEPILSPFMLWRIVLVSLLFMACAFGMFHYALGRGLPVEAGHTLVVNVIVVLEIFYLFSVRYVHGTSLTLQGIVGTGPVLAGVLVITLAQFAFTYTSFMQEIFGTRPMSLHDGLLVVGAGVAFLLVIEIEKRVLRALGIAQS